MKNPIKFSGLLWLLLFLAIFPGCKDKSTTTDESFTFITKEGYYVDYKELDIYRDSETKKPLNGYYVVGNELTKWEEFNVENGILNGEYLFYHPNGTISIRSMYVNGRLHGDEYFYYPSGAVQQKQTYVKDVVHGEKLDYYESGQVKNRSIYENGKSDTHTRYDLLGNITGQDFVEDGIAISQRIKNGKVFYENLTSTYDDYEAVKIYDESGDLKHHLRMLMVDDSPIILELDADGNTIERFDFERNPQKVMEYMRLIIE